MNRTLTEQKVLRKLGIQDFRHMTKEKVTGFVSMLPRMDPEVAKKALEQFPDFTKTAIAITTDLKDGLEKLVGSNANNMREINAACRSILDSLEAELAREDRSEEERARIIDSMLQVAQLMSEKDTENKAFLREVGKYAAGACLVVVFALAAVLGVGYCSTWGSDET